MRVDFTHGSYVQKKKNWLKSIQCLFEKSSPIIWRVLSLFWINQPFAKEFVSYPCFPTCKLGCFGKIDLVEKKIKLTKFIIYLGFMTKTITSTMALGRLQTTDKLCLETRNQASSMLLKQQHSKHQRRLKIYK